MGGVRECVLTECISNCAKRVYCEGILCGCIARLYCVGVLRGYVEKVYCEYEL